VNSESEPRRRGMPRLYRGDSIMYTGTMIEDLIHSVERAEKHAREQQEFRLEFYDYPAIRRQAQELEVA